MKYPYTCDGMLSIECQTPIKQTLNKNQASELTALIAKDLNAVLKVTKESALVVCGAAFASEQLLQPKFPIQDSITQYASAAFQGQLNADQILSIGASDDPKFDGLMPAGLQPKAAPQNLLHLPFCLYTHDLDLAERFESELMHKGMVSPPTYAQLMEILQVTITHANYMTYLDLVAMLHNHYEQLGLSHLWQVIETALVNKAPKTAVETQTNNHFFLIDHLLFTPSFSWAQFNQYFNDKDAEDYINWLMAQRLSLGAFAVHGLEIRAFKAQLWPLNKDKICLGEFEKASIKQTYWTESVADFAPSSSAEVIHYTHPQAGIVAVAIRSGEKTSDIHYPINPQGLGDIEKTLNDQYGQDYATIKRDFASHAQQLIP